MALRNIIAKRKTFIVSGEEFSVGAIDATIAVMVLQNRMGEAKALFDAAQKEGLTKDPDPFKIVTLALALAPDLIAEIIAHAAGEPDAVEMARSLPITAQLEAIEAIFDLTFEAEGGLKKFGETVVRLLEKSTAALEEVNGKKATR